MIFVLDASMALAWHFRDERTDFTRAVSRRAFDGEVSVPAHWFGEVCNTLLVGERKGRTTREGTEGFLARLDELLVVFDELDEVQAGRRSLELARVHRLTVYDAFYLELAQRQRLPLATLDKDLRAAARRAGVSLIEELL